MTKQVEFKSTCRTLLKFSGDNENLETSYDDVVDYLECICKEIIELSTPQGSLEETPCKLLVLQVAHAFVADNAFVHCSSRVSCTWTPPKGVAAVSDSELTVKKLRINTDSSSNASFLLHSSLRYST